MDIQNSKILSWRELEDETRGNALVVSDKRVFGTKEFRQYLIDKIGFIVNIENETDEDVQAEFIEVIDKLTNGKPARFMDYIFEYNDCNLIS